MSSLLKTNIAAEPNESRNSGPLTQVKQLYTLAAEASARYDDM
ncbi:hypothetical protein ACFPN2_32480 [Steroidobacter flavus]|uniref:Uncharacterized protein n=1 Tax=Steroidobacter flavus TaxID=1842136 RepID=A0ABV8T1N8_9GAMM